MLIAIQLIQQLVFAGLHTDDQVGPESTAEIPGPARSNYGYDYVNVIHLMIWKSENLKIK